MPTTFYSEEEYQRLQHKCTELETRITVLEQMQPAWVADQWHVVAALSQLWKMLGANNQTAAVQAVKHLKGEIS